MLNMGELYGAEIKLYLNTAVYLKKKAKQLPTDI